LKVYGPGASVKLWDSILSEKDELWEAEVDEKCVHASKIRGDLNGTGVVTGDQGSIATLNDWVHTIGSDIDIIIDDGGHRNDQIYKTFMTLWPHLKPGGYYFIEDLQVGRDRSYHGDDPSIGPMIHYIIGWIEWKVFRTLPVGSLHFNPKGSPIPQGIRFITCQAEMCVIAKCNENLHGASLCT
jgi:hypothetical protein